MFTSLCATPCTKWNGLSPGTDYGKINVETSSAIGPFSCDVRDIRSGKSEAKGLKFSWIQLKTDPKRFLSCNWVYGHLISPKILYFQ